MYWFQLRFVAACILLSMLVEVPTSANAAKRDNLEKIAVSGAVEEHPTFQYLGGEVEDKAWAIGMIAALSKVWAMWYEVWADDDRAFQSEGGFDGVFGKTNIRAHGEINEWIFKNKRGYLGRFSDQDIAQLAKQQIESPRIKNPTCRYHREFNRLMAVGNRGDALSPATVLFAAAEFYYFASYFQILDGKSGMTNKYYEEYLWEADLYLNRCEKAMAQYADLTDPSLQKHVSKLRKAIERSRGGSGLDNLLGIVKWFSSQK